MKAIYLLMPLLPLVSFSQERCATDAIEANQVINEHKASFETWMKERITLKMATRHRMGMNGLQQQVYEIPVVFHIIHKGTPVGTGSNISSAKIEEQVEILNQDFRRQNPDASNTPEDFLPVAADTEIRFVLARQDPEGLPTDGIVRVRGSKDIYQAKPSNDDILLKSESFWPPEDYLNIYVTDLAGGYLGYAQYPFANLPGLESELENYRNTDGVVLDYNWVGLNDKTGSFPSKGRTATHEIGHFLGLRHIWGEGGCGVDDYCADTPAVSGNSGGVGSPCTYPGKNSCTEEENDLPDMFQNYMDYTDDECMNLFTECQKQRMRTILELSPRRASLLTSHALDEPIQVANDLGIRSVISPTKSTCSSQVIPNIEMRNYGTNPITSFQAELYLNGDLIETVSHAIDLPPLALTNVAFSALAIPENQENEIRFHISQVNGVADENLINNDKVVRLPTVESQLLPYTEDFHNNAGSVFRTTETSASSLWSFVNSTAFLPFYDQLQNYGVQDRLLTEVFDLSSLTSAEITFRYAYAPRLTANPDTSFLDGLIVAVSTDCGQQFYQNDFLFERYGSQLATTSPTNAFFEPTDPGEWNEITLNLTNHTGHDNVQVAFIGVNGGGNNIYLDDIHITSANLLAHDAGIRSVTSLPITSCSGNLSPYIEIKNFGYEKITSLSLSMTINGEARLYVFDDLNVLSGFSESLRINTDEELDEGVYHITFTIDEINGQLDEQPANNLSAHQVIVNSDLDVIPVKEDFDDMEWVIASPTGDFSFEEVHLNRNDMLAGKAFDASNTGITYLVSPTLETMNYTEASIRFKYSYAKRTGFYDNLKVVLSFNCGRSYTEEVLNLNAEQLAVTSSNQEWEPNDEDDWKTAFIDISEHLSWNEIRVAFIFFSGGGNNLYLDDIEISTSADPDLPEFEDLMVIYPNPIHPNVTYGNPADRGVFYVKLNLIAKQDVEIRIVDMSGRVVHSQQFPGSINQRYRFVAPKLAGFYLVQLLGSDGVLNQVKRLYISH